jgi:hypothetical protein
MMQTLPRRLPFARNSTVTQWASRPVLVHTAGRSGSDDSALVLTHVWPRRHLLLEGEGVAVGVLDHATLPELSEWIPRLSVRS